MKETLAIIGSGNMGQAIANGLLKKNVVAQRQLFLTNSQTRNNKEVVEKANIIILAVKPQVAQLVMDEIKNSVKDQLIISIMAGITIDFIQQALGKDVAVVRVMPNLAARVGKSMSVWVKSKEVTLHQEEITKTILEAIGMQLELAQEEQINMATAISGSGPAYFFYITELIEQAAEQLGFSKKQARLLVRQTFLGAAELFHVSEIPAEDLRRAVSSKGGTTEAAIEVFQKAELQHTLAKGILAGYTRADELGKASGK